MRGFLSISVEYRGNPQPNGHQISVGRRNWNDDSCRAEQFQCGVTFLPHIEQAKSMA
jgi:hypothetical protein